MTKKLISIVLPAYKEEKNISLIYNEIQKVFSDLEKNYNFEIIFVNDWSPDNTWDEILKLCEKDKCVKWINLSRNFWKEIAITAGIESSVWDAVITLDWDWQHPVDKIPKFIKFWENWYDMVYNKRPKTEWVWFVKRSSSKFFYKIFNLFSDFKLEESTTDYRLLDRKLVENFKMFWEKNRMYRGLTDWMWYKKKALVFDAKKRLDWWKSTYWYKQLYNLAINSLTSFSVFPLKLVWYLGFFLTFFWTIMFIFMITDKLLYDKFSFSNLAIILIVNTILIWIVLMSLGLIALYIARIHEEVQKRPMYLIQDKINFKN